MEPKIIKTYEESTEFEALFESAMKCKLGKMWKASVARFILHVIEECLNLEEELANDTYKPRKPHSFTLYYPKVRPCSSTHIRDRVVQRSLNDNLIYPAMTKSFIFDNLACQKGKGTTKAMDRLNRQMHRYYINNGNSTKGYVLQVDVRGYYKNIRHEDAKVCFSRHLDGVTVYRAMSWLQRQYPYPVGYEPGSQMVQILGISLLDPLDHAVKELEKARNYERYMDDLIIISADREHLERCLERIKAELAKLGLEVHPTKTRIYPLSEGIRFLGFTFRLTKTGKVVRIINPENVKHERKKLYRMAELVKKGELPAGKLYECYNAWKAHAKLGNSHKLIVRTDAYVKDLMKGVKQCA